MINKKIFFFEILGLMLIAAIPLFPQDEDIQNEDEQVANEHDVNEQYVNDDNSVGVYSEFFGPVNYHWYIGLFAGYANNSLYTSTGDRKYTEYQNGHGWNIAIPIRYQILPWLGVGAEIKFITKNYTYQRIGAYRGVYNEYTNSFLDFPMYANLSKGFGNFRLFANLGGFIGIWLDSHVKAKNITSTVDPWTAAALRPISIYHSTYEKVPFDKRRDNLFDAGLFAGLGVQYNLFKHTSLFIEGRFYYTLTDLQKPYQKNIVPKMNDTWTVQLGAMFNAGILELKIQKKKTNQPPNVQTTQEQ